MSNYREAVIEAESREHEAGVTLGALNRTDHICAEGNRSLLHVESGHLEYVLGKGVRKIEERDCSLCIDRGYNDGKWH